MTAPWRSATVEEIRTYYREVFPEHVEKLSARFKPPGPKEYGIGFRQEFPTVGDSVPPRNFVRRSSWSKHGMRFSGWDDFLKWLQAPAAADPLQDDDKEKALADPMLVDQRRPVPECVYYSLRHHERPWVVMIDIDAKDVARERDADEEEIEAAPPEGFAYTFEDIQQAIEYGFQTKRLFEEEFGAEETEVVYSGQGVHVYLLDADRYHRYDKKSRQVITTLFTEHYGIPIDPVVTPDPARFGRLPYSLHADICRVVQPIESPSFDFRREAAPSFLSEQSPEVAQADD